MGKKGKKGGKNKRDEEDWPDSGDEGKKKEPTKNDKKGKGDTKKEKRSKADKLEAEKRYDEKERLNALPKYLTEGLTILDKDVSFEGLYIYTPDGTYTIQTSLFPPTLLPRLF